MSRPHVPDHTSAADGVKLLDIEPNSDAHASAERLGTSMARLS